jgi:quinol monooxygenase YgiN
MFGTIAVVKPRPGQEAAVVEHFNRWWKDRAPRVPGVLMGTLNRNTSNPAELMMTVVFASANAYQNNANDPEQDRWFRELVPLLEEEPRWIDGDVLAAHSRGAV